MRKVGDPIIFFCINSCYYANVIQYIMCHLQERGTFYYRICSGNIVKQGSEKNANTIPAVGLPFGMAVQFLPTNPVY